MNLRRTDVFIADLERQFEWYARKDGLELANRYIEAVEATVRLIGRHPFLGPPGGFTHVRLREWRYFLVCRPFREHILFYEILAGELVMRRAMHGRRDLPRRVIETGGQ